MGKTVKSVVDPIGFTDKKTWTGGISHEGNVGTLTKEQKKYLSKILGSNTKDAKRAFADLLEGPEGVEDLLGQTGSTLSNLMGQGYDQGAFQQGVVNPMMQNYRQNVLPAVQQRFVDANAGSSSALNQALASSANDLTTQLGSLYLPFRQQQQQAMLAGAQGGLGLYGTSLGGRTSALSGLGSLSGQSAFTPMIRNQEGILGPMIGAGGAIGAAAMMSSEKVKENIRDYSKGLDVVKGLDVKIYDYKEEAGGAKNKVGVIAEKVPEEISGVVNGVKAVDLYGLIGILINAVKELNQRVEDLEDTYGATYSN